VVGEPTDAPARTPDRTPGTSVALASVVIGGGTGVPGAELARVLTLADQSLWQDLGTLDEALVAGVAGFGHPVPRFGLAAPGHRAVVCCLPPSVPSPRIAAYRLGYLLRIAAPRRVAVLRLLPAGSRRQRRTGTVRPSVSMVDAWLAGILRAACGRRIPVISAGFDEFREGDRGSCRLARSLLLALKASIVPVEAS